jgi:hypothetical protein
MVTAFFAAYQIKLISKQVKQRGPWLDGELSGLAIDSQA